MHQAGRKGVACPYRILHFDFEAVVFVRSTPTDQQAAICSASHADQIQLELRQRVPAKRHFVVSNNPQQFRHPSA